MIPLQSSVQTPPSRNLLVRYPIPVGILILLLWYGLYRQLEPFSHLFVYSFLGMTKGNHMA